MTSMTSWSEVQTAKKENRRELVLTGKEIAERVAEFDFDENVFNLSQLNFLRITRIGLSVLSPKIEQLNNLTSLVLHFNNLTNLPASIGNLTKLKMLDISMNQLSLLPPEMSTLKELQTLIASGNQLTEFVDISNMVKLLDLDVSNNKLKSLPPGIDSEHLECLLNVSAQNNEIEDLPVSLGCLSSLKMLDVSNNKLVSLPPQLSECPKLKDLRCSGNKLKDNRLLKLVDQCTTKAVLDYLSQKNKENVNGDKKKGRKKGQAQKSENEEDFDSVIKILSHDAEKGVLVKVMPNVLNVRPYIVCCVIKNINFGKSETLMKDFIKLQTKLHDEICEKRQVATIATHDLEKVNGPLLYDAKSPSSIKIKPLNRTTEVTARSLVDKLLKEAEDCRKAKKRNTVSGIHKYLSLLANHSEYPYIEDSLKVTISFPPIVNGESTKVTESTKHILVEVTGPGSLDSCKKVMEELLSSLLEMGICEDLDSATPEVQSAKKLLILEQVKIVDSLNNLRVLYPSRVDLQSSNYKVIREHD